MLQYFSSATPNLSPLNTCSDPHAAADTVRSEVSSGGTGGYGLVGNRSDHPTSRILGDAVRTEGAIRVALRAITKREFGGALEREMSDSPAERIVGWRP
jgi:hypothetical protein